MSRNRLSKKYHLILSIVSVFVIAVFTLQNAEVITVSFLFWKLQMSRVILILILLLLGFLLGYIVRSLRK
ncbi:MAG: lipopolysaccharide assembly protein LapA domain-containing protein [Gammaproteobacteria bacterium]|nr:lipopolysaccharide assembly protein LapA domain-containing protein [Gammaproteobacteria bacterium]MDH5735970.1 lipopolysaccharide assembly protein LapA domain-containing protein [Gammaproteobacteria bacterium]